MVRLAVGGLLVLGFLNCAPVEVCTREIVSLLEVVTEEGEESLKGMQEEKETEVIDSLLLTSFSAITYPFTFGSW